MDKYIFLVKGEKGLYYSDGKRIYFPDRSWTDAKEGIATDVEITLDKQYYAFIKGTMVKTKEIKELDAIYDANMDDLSKMRIFSFGDSQILGMYGTEYVDLFANIDDTIVKLCSSVIPRFYGYRHQSSRTTFLGLVIDNKNDIHAKEEFDLEWYERNCKIKNHKEFMQACINLYTMYCYAAKSIELVDDLYLHIIYDNGNDNVVVIDLSDYNKKGTYASKSLYNFKLFGIITDSITIKELEDEMIKLKISGSHYYSSYSGEVEKKFGENLRQYIDLQKVKVFNQEFDFYCLDSSCFNYDLLETDLYKKISELHDSYIKTIQSFGKKCSGKQMISELQSASPRKLMLKRRF